MGKEMKERLKRKPLPTALGILTIIGLFACILVLHGLMNVLAHLLNISFLEYIEYVLFILIGLLIIRRWIIEYEYAVVDDELYVDRYLGKRPKQLLAIKLNYITYIGKTLPNDYTGKKQRLTYKRRAKGVTYIVYISKDDKKCVYFSPSEKLLALLDKRMS